MYLLIDNYDSFTYNLYQYFLKEHINITIKRNDKITFKDIHKINPSKIIISPGPKTPKQSGISKQIIKEFGTKIPILGICLGHQCIADTFGGKVNKLNKIIHGNTSKIYHNKKGIFNNIPNPFLAARYHSLIVTKLPSCFEIIAWTKNKIIMGIQHKKWPIIGLQFHPESFLTEKGETIIKNFIKI